MGDSSKFVNAYIENSMSMIHEQVALILQLKAQVKVTDDIIAEKDQIIASMVQEVENAKSELNNNKTDLSQLNEKINENNALKGQLEHMNTFTNQINEMKQMIREKDKEIGKLKAKLEPKGLKPAPKKDINKKEVTQDIEPLVMKEPETEDKNDDF
jgi:septal ring factor EnvC (AmiA/AmiB activator)